MLIHSNTDLRLPTTSTSATGKLNSPGSYQRFQPIVGPQNNEDFKRFLQLRIDDTKPKELQQVRSQTALVGEKRSNNPKPLSLPIVNKTIQEYPSSTRPPEVRRIEEVAPMPNPFDMLWNSNYLTKYNINDYIEENKAFKAKVWNYEKENRKMLRQLEQWGLADQINNDAKPFVDSSTLQKVYKDSQYLTVTKKQQMLARQQVLYEREAELTQIQQQIDKQRQDASILEDFEKDSIKDFYVVLHKAQVHQTNRVQEDAQGSYLLQLEEKKSVLRSQASQLLDVNNVYQFEVEVQQNMYKKLVREAQQLVKRTETLDTYIDRLEDTLKEKQPLTLNQLQNQKSRQKKKPQVIGKIEKTSDEILRDRISLIDEQKKKVEQLNFQIQEMTRTCIMEKQDLLKDITDTKVELRELSDKILHLKLNIIKFDQFDQSVSSDKSNQRGDSLITQYSQ